MRSMDATPPPQPTPTQPTLTPAERAAVLAELLPSLRAQQGQTLVIKYGGNAMTEPALQLAFAQDVVLLQLLGMRPVVVHGGGPHGFTECCWLNF